VHSIGRFRGSEGTIVCREREVRLLVAINFIQQGASCFWTTLKSKQFRWIHRGSVTPGIESGRKVKLL
jgi:hypothetical protein